MRNLARFLLLAIAIACAPLAAAGCGSLAALESGGALIPGALTLEDDKAYARVRAAGVVPAELDIQVREISRRARGYLAAADTARRAGNASTFAEQLAGAIAATAQITAATPKRSN